MSRPSRAESLGERGQVVAHIAKIKQTAVCTRLVIKMMTKEENRCFACLLQTDPRPFPLFPFAHHFLQPGEFVPLLPLPSLPPFKPGEFALFPNLPFLFSRASKETPAHLLRGEQET